MKMYNGGKSKKYPMKKGKMSYPAKPGRKAEKGKIISKKGNPHRGY